MIENGAQEMGIDPLELRARNLIPPEKFPYQTALGITYDSGDPPVLMEKIKALADYDALRAEQAKLRAKGQWMGIGISAFFDMAGAGPVKMMNDLGAKVGCYDVASVRVHPDGRITVFAGSHSHGQGHETTWSQIAADRLGCDIDHIDLVEGDTDRVPMGIGTWGSRSLSTAGMAVYTAADRVVAKAKRMAAHMMECAPEDLDLADGEFTVKGTDRKLSFAAVANASYHSGDRPPDLEIGLEETSFFDPTDCTYPSAIHLCVVLVDPETCAVTLRDYWAVDDVGTVINPMVLHGQVHGGLVQGIGQALMEECAYDAESGQYLSGTFMDYAITPCGGRAVLRPRCALHAGAGQPAWGQGGRRERHHRRAGLHLQRSDRRALASRRAADHAADDAQEDLARHRGREADAALGPESVAGERRWQAFR